jgi:hypothetical protein
LKLNNALINTKKRQVCEFIALVMRVLYVSTFVERVF